MKCQVCLCLFMSHAVNIFDISLNIFRNRFNELHEEVECYVVFLATNFCNSNFSDFALFYLLLVQLNPQLATI